MLEISLIGQHNSAMLWASIMRLNSKLPYFEWNKIHSYLDARNIIDRVTEQCNAMTAIMRMNSKLPVNPEV